MLENIFSNIVRGIINGLESIFGYKMADTILTAFISTVGLLFIVGTLYALFYACKPLMKWAFRRRK